MLITDYTRCTTMYCMTEYTVLNKSYNTKFSEVYNTIMLLHRVDYRLHKVYNTLQYE